MTKPPFSRVTPAFVLTALCLMATFDAAAQNVPAAIAFGARHAVALRSNGEVLTWGENIGCQLGRGGGNASATPGLVLRNATAVAAAADHTLALTADGRVYAWGSNNEGALGTGKEYDECEGPALVASLADTTITHIATGKGFSVAVSTDGRLFCTGDNSMGQCPRGRGGPFLSFAEVPLPEIAGRVAAVAAGGFHTLVLLKGGSVFAFGRGRDGQLGNGVTRNGQAMVPALTDVVAISAGMWHSAAVRADGSVWLWGNDLKSQLCDGATANKSVPTRVESLPVGATATHVAAGGHSTLIRLSDGTLLGCGDNQFRPLGADQPAVVTMPARLAAGVSGAGLAIGGGNGAFSPDGCAVRVSGDNDRGIVSAAGGSAYHPFVVRAGLMLCGTRTETPVIAAGARPSVVVNAPPPAGQSGCWTPRVEEDASTDPRFASLRQSMLAAEALLRQNPAFMAAPVPVRYRSSFSISPLENSARVHVKAVPERKADGTRLWTGTCGVIPQVDRIGGAIFQVSVFFNLAARGPMLGATGRVPTQTGVVAGHPEFDGWVLLTSGGRLPWVPLTVADALDAEGARRKAQLADWVKTSVNAKPIDPAAIQNAYDAMKTLDPAAAAKMRTQLEAIAAEAVRQQRDVAPATTAQFEKAVSDYETYRATLTAAQLAAPAVWRGPTTGTSRALHAAHQDLSNIAPGPAEHAMGVKPDAAFPDPRGSGRVEAIAIHFPDEPDPRQVERRAWRQRVRERFDFAALAALVR